MIIMRDIVVKLVASGVMMLPISLAKRAIRLRIMRREAHLAMLGATMLPLCLLRSLAALAKVSWVGMGGVIYLACFLGYRWAAGAYQPGGQFARASVSSSAFFGERVVRLKLAVFVSMLHGCYQVHFDAPRVFNAVAYMPSALERFKRLARVSFLVAGLVNTCVLVTSFLTFGATAKTVVLDNYAENDWGAVLGRLAVLVSLMSSYPLMFNGFASNMLNLATFFAPPRDDADGEQLQPSLDEYTRQGIKDALAVSLVGFNVCMGLWVEDLGFICAFTGSFISGFIIFVFPPIFHMRVLSMRAARRGDGGGGPSAWAPGEEALWWGSAAIASLGLALCLTGTAVTFGLI